MIACSQGRARNSTGTPMNQTDQLGREDLIRRLAAENPLLTEAELRLLADMPEATEGHRCPSFSRISGGRTNPAEGPARRNSRRRSRPR